MFCVIEFIKLLCRVWSGSAGDGVFIIYFKVASIEKSYFDETFTSDTMKVKYSNLMKYLVLSESVATEIIVKLSFSNVFTSKAYLFKT